MHTYTQNDIDAVYQVVSARLARAVVYYYFSGLSKYLCITVKRLLLDADMCYLTARQYSLLQRLHTVLDHAFLGTSITTLISTSSADRDLVLYRLAEVLGDDASQQIDVWLIQPIPTDIQQLRRDFLKLLLKLIVTKNSDKKLHTTANRVL